MTIFLVNVMFDTLLGGRVFDNTLRANSENQRGKPLQVCRKKSLNSRIKEHRLFEEVGVHLSAEA